MCIKGREKEKRNKQEEMAREKKKKYMLNGHALKVLQLISYTPDNFNAIYITQNILLKLN